MKVKSNPQAQASAGDTDFARAVGVRRLAYLARDSPVLRARREVFLLRREWPEERLLQHVRDVLSRSEELTPEALERFLGTIPIARLRTYTDEQLLTVSRNFAHWSPLVNYLQNPQAGDADDRHRRTFEELVRRLEAQLRKRWRGSLGGGDADDAIQDALLEVLRTSGDRERGYIYEGDFLGWLYRTARNRLLLWLRGAKKLEPEAAEADGLAPPAADALQEIIDGQFLRDYRERYLLVESFFQPQVRERVKAIWSSLLLNGEERDKTLRARVERETGEPLQINTLITTRRKLRQRLETLRYVLDRVPAGHEDAPGDVSMLEWIALTWGWSDEDRPTLRHLAALGRAARGENTLAWALLARYCVDNKGLDGTHEGGSGDARERIERMLRARGVFDEDAARLDAAFGWLRSHLHDLTALRREAVSAGLSFYLSACWYLSVLRCLDAEGVVRVLRPHPSGEEAGLLMLLTKF